MTDKSFMTVRELRDAILEQLDAGLVDLDTPVQVGIYTEQTLGPVHMLDIHDYSGDLEELELCVNVDDELVDRGAELVLPLT